MAQRLPGSTPGGDRETLPLWINDFFELGELSGRVLVNPTNPVQRSVAVTVGAICPELNAAGDAVAGASVDLRERCNEIIAGLVDDEDQAGALNGLQAMGAEENSVIANTEVDHSATHRADIGERLANLRAGLGGPAVALNGRRLDLEAGAQGGNAGLGSGQWSFFIDGAWGWGDKDGTNVETGFDVDSYGVTAGLDYRASRSTVMGAALGYTRLEADLAGDSGQLDTDSGSIFLYSSYTGSDNWYLDGMLGWTGSDHDQERTVRYSITPATGPSQVNQSAESSNDSDEWSVSFELGYNHYGDRWSVSPYGRLDYADVDIDGYTERMSRPSAPGRGLAVAIDSQDYQSLTLALGLTGYMEIPMSWGSLLPQFTAEYVHEYQNDNEPITGYFVDALSRTRFSIPTDEPDRDYLNLALGVTALVTDTTSAYLQYQTLQGYRDQSLNEVRLGVKVDF